MSIQSTQEEEQVPPEEQSLPPHVQAQLRQGRKAARDLETANAVTKQMELTVAIERSGLPDHPARELVFKDYDGPLDPDSIKAFGGKYGIVATHEPTDPGPSAEETAAQRAILNAGGGAPAASGDIDLAVALRAAKSQAEVMAIVAQVAGNPGFKGRNGLIGELPPPI